MTNSNAASSTTKSYPVNQQHNLDSPLQQAIDLFEAAASRFSIDCIKDANVRQAYMANIKRMSAEIKAEVDGGKISVKEGAEFCQEMRNKIMAEARAVSSAQGRAKAESIKQKGLMLETLLDTYAENLFNKKFSQLDATQKSKVYYAVIESSGRDRAKFTAGTLKLRLIGKVGVLITAALAVHSVAIADNKPKETIRQGAIIGGGMAGGLGAGLTVSSLCGPGFVICAVAVVLIGSVAGGYAAEKAVDCFDDELEEFTRWNIH